jgi:heme exporter protein D
MQFSTLSEFLAMGGYALYVWGSYAVTGLILGAALVQPFRRRRQLLAELRRARRRELRGREVAA